MRVTCPRQEDAALAEIWHSQIQSRFIHFNRAIFAAIGAGCAAVQVNPNIKSDGRVGEVAKGGGVRPDPRSRIVNHGSGQTVHGEYGKARRRWIGAVGGFFREWLR